MFAYCNNNPILYSDQTGHLAWITIAGIFISGGVSALSTLLNGGSLEDILKDAVIGSATAALISLCPSMAGVVSSYSLLQTLLDCMYDGYSFEATLAKLGLTAVSNASLSLTGVPAIDDAMELSFGTGKNLACAGAEAGVNKNAVKEKKDPEKVSNQLFGMIAVGGGRAKEVTEGWKGIRSVWLVP